MTGNHRSGNSRYPARDNIRNDSRLYTRARVMRSIEVAWSLFEYCHVEIGDSDVVYTIYLENKLNIVVRHPSVPSNP